jgi:hypothetical protein
MAFSHLFPVPQHDTASDPQAAQENREQVVSAVTWDKCHKGQASGAKAFRRKSPGKREVYCAGGGGLLRGLAGAALLPG